MSVLAQDQAQASAAQNIIAQKKYEQDSIQYAKDQERYKKETEIYNQNVEKQKESNRLAEIELQKQIAQAKIDHAKAQEASFWKQSHVVLDRTTADHINKGHGVASQFNPEQKLMLAKARARQAVSAGTMTIAQGLTAIGSAAEVWSKESHERTIRTAAKFKRSAASSIANAQLQSAQVKELQRLGGSGSLESGNTGPTKISETLVTDTPSVANRVEVASGTADKAQPWESGFTVQTKQFGYATTGQAEVNRLNAVKTYEAQQDIDKAGVNVNAAQLQALGLSTLYQQGEFGYLKPTAPPTAPVKPTRTGEGTTSNPFKSGQPNGNLVSKYLTPYTVTITQGGETVTKRFTSQKGAEEFVYKKNLSLLATPMLLGGIYTNQFLQKELQGPVKPKEETKEKHTFFGQEITDPKTVETLDFIQDRVGLALAPITNIPVEINNLITSGEEKTRPTFVGSLFSDAIGAGYESVKQGTLTPTLEKQPGTDAWNFLSKDPFGVISQIPAEAVLLVAGGKVVKGITTIGGKVFQKLPSTTQKSLSSGKNVITKPIQKATDTIIPRYARANELGFYKGIVINNKPVVGVSQGKLVFGTPKNIPTSKIDLGNRSAGELALGYGPEKEIFYSKGAFTQYKQSGFVNELSEVRATHAISVQATTSPQGKIYTGALGKAPAKTISDPQFKSLLKVAEEEYVAGKIHPVHGSLSTRTHMEPNLRQQGGDYLKLGDLDISPVYTKKGGEALFEKEASRIIQKAAQRFPLKKGETLKVTDKIGESRSLEFTPAPGGNLNPKPVKIFEVLVKDKQSPLGNIKNDPTHIMGERVPHDTVLVVGTKLETSSLRYQILTNLKTKTAFQEYKHTGSLTPRIIGTELVSVKDSPAKAMIYVGQGREKDIVRSYYTTLQTSQNQARAGLFKSSQKSAREAQEIKNLYPELNFEKGFKQKVEIAFDTPSTKSVGTSERLVGVTGFNIRSESKSQTAEIKKVQPKSVATSKGSITKLPSSKIGTVTSTSLRGSISKIPNRTQSKYPSSVRNTPSKLSRVTLPSISVTGSAPSNPTSKPPSKVTSKPPSSPPSRPLSKTPSRPLSVRPTTILTTKTDLTSKKRTKIVAGIFDLRSTRQKDPERKTKQLDFVGNTKLDSIEGLINRETIITGRKRVTKAVRKGRKTKFRNKGVNFFSG